MRKVFFITLAMLAVAGMAAAQTPFEEISVYKSRDLPPLNADSTNLNLVYIDTTRVSGAILPRWQGFYIQNRTRGEWDKVVTMGIDQDSLNNSFRFSMLRGTHKEEIPVVLPTSNFTGLWVICKSTLPSATPGGLLYFAVASQGIIADLGVQANGELPIGDGSGGPTRATITPTTNEIDVTNGAGTITLSLPATIDLGGKTSFEIPNAAAPTVDAFGEIAGDNNLWASGRGAPVFYDGTAATALVNVLVSDTPSNGQVPKWNTGGTITWEDDNNSGGATAWDAIGDPVATATVNFGGTTQTIDGNTNDVTAIAQDLLSLNYTNDGATDVLTQRILVLNKLAASTNALERGLVIDNQDGAALDVAIEVVGTSTGAITTALKLDDAEIGTWANIGANDLVTAATTLASTELDRLDGKDAALIDVNDSPVITGAWDAGGATSFEIPNGANPTVSVAGQISIDSEGTTESAVRFFSDAEYVLPARYSKSFTIIAPISTDDYPLWKVPYAITIRAIHILCVGGTNIIGGLDEADGNGTTSVAIDADITGSAATNANDDGSLTNPTLDAADYLMWHTTSISGLPTSVTITFEYTVDSVP